MVEREKLPTQLQSNVERIEKETMYLLKGDDGITQLVLNRPHVRNAINKQGFDDLKGLVDIVAQDTSTRVLTIRGEGKVFCSGVDLNYLTSEEMNLAFFKKWEKVMRTLETMDKIVIAGMHGFAISAGVQIGLASDIRVASDDLILRIPKEPVVTGLAYFRLPRFIGEGRAKKLLLTGMNIHADEAIAIGLVDYVIPREKFDIELGAIAKDASHGITGATFLTKQLLAKTNGENYRYSHARYMEEQKIALASADFAAFKISYFEERQKKLQQPQLT